MTETIRGFLVRRSIEVIWWSLLWNFSLCARINVGHGVFLEKFSSAPAARPRTIDLAAMSYFKLFRNPWYIPLFFCYWFFSLFFLSIIDVRGDESAFGWKIGSKHKALYRTTSDVRIWNFRFSCRMSTGFKVALLLSLFVYLYSGTFIEARTPEATEYSAVLPGISGWGLCHGYTSENLKRWLERPLAAPSRYGRWKEAKELHSIERTARETAAGGCW